MNKVANKMIVHYIEIKHFRKRKFPSVMQFFHGGRKCFLQHLALAN